MEMNEKKRFCSECGDGFTFMPEFFDDRGFKYPKRCVRCAAKVRGRTPPQTDKQCVCFKQNVRLSLPQFLIQDPTYLQRKDTVSRKNYYSCLKFYLCPSKGNRITVYDQRNSDPENFVPLEGGIAFASVRIMSAKKKKSDESYEYIVLDHSKDLVCDWELVLILCDGVTLSGETEGELWSWPSGGTQHILLRKGRKNGFGNQNRKENQETAW